MQYLVSEVEPGAGPELRSTFSGGGSRGGAGGRTRDSGIVYNFVDFGLSLSRRIFLNFSYFK